MTLEALEGAKRAYAVAISMGLVNVNAHDLMPEWLARITPELYSQDEDPDPVVWAKWFTPDSSWTWYITEYSETAPDGTPRLAFGLVDGWEVELGYISLDEVSETAGPWGLGVERDLWFTPKLLSEVRAELGR